MTWRYGRTWLAAGAGLAVVLALLGLPTVAGAQPGPDTTTTTAPSVGSPAPDADRGAALPFQWDDPRMKDAFQACMEIVDHIAHRRKSEAERRQDQRPAGVGEDLWNEATNEDFFGLNFNRHNHVFEYRPRCDELLPANYEARVSVRYYSDVYNRCLAMVGGEGDRKRPDVVPAWYWEVSKRIGDCYLLLPLGAFGLGADENAWSQWKAEDEEEGPNPASASEPLRAEYQHCLDFIGWRMNGGATFSGLGSLYDDPPREASPKRLWHEALHYFVDPTQTSPTDGATVPAEWKPNCELLLTAEECQPSGPSNPSLLPETCIGPHSTWKYDIGYSQYDDPDEEGLPSISRNLWGASTQYAFMIARGGVEVAIWAVDWSYNFDISQYNAVALGVGNDYIRLLDHPQLRLRELFWLLLVGWVGFMALRGRFATAGSELLITIVLVLLTTFLLANREMYMNATWRLMAEGETTLLVAGMGDDPAAASSAQRTELIRDLQRSIHFAFVEQPYDYLNWGESLGKRDAPACSDTQPRTPPNCNPLRNCAAARDHIVGRGPHGTDKWPRRQMAAAGPECEPLAEFNRNPDGTRLLGAILVMLSGLAVAVMLVIVGLTVVVAKVIAFLLFAVAPFATLVAILPAYGRRLTWTWAATLIQVVLAVVGMSFLLSLLLLTLRALIDATDQVDLIERFALMDILVAIVFVARRNLLHSGQRFAARLSEYLSSARGTGTTWASAASSAGPGLDLLNVDRGVMYSTGYPAGALGATLLLRMQERRVARRSYLNLQRVSRWKRDENARNRAWAQRNAGRRRWWVAGRPIDPADPTSWPVPRQPLP